MIKALGISLLGFSISSTKVATTSKPRKLKIITDRNDNPKRSIVGSKSIALSIGLALSPVFMNT